MPHKLILSAQSRKEAFKTIAWGLGWVLGALSLWLHLAGNPIHDLRLVLHASTAPGHVIDTWEDVGDGDDGRAHFVHGIVYRFRLPDGREARGYTGTRSGRLSAEWIDLKEPIPVDVEYDPSDPSINRLKGDGSQNFIDWLLRKVGLGGLLLILFVSPGVKLIRDGIQELRGNGERATSSGHSAD